MYNYDDGTAQKNWNESDENLTYLLEDFPNLKPHFIQSIYGQYGYDYENAHNALLEVDGITDLENAVDPNQQNETGYNNETNELAVDEQQSHATFHTSATNEIRLSLEAEFPGIEPGIVEMVFEQSGSNYEAAYESLLGFL